MNNRPPISSSSADVINSYRKRRQRRNPNTVYILAGVFVLGGVILLIWWLAGPDKPIGRFFATDTPTPTLTYTPTNTPIPTETPTVTSTSTVTPTATFSSPFNYTVQDGDYLALIVEKYNLGENGIALILMLNPYYEDSGIGIDPSTQIVSPGQVIRLPNPGMELPTATPIPANLPRGTKVEYTVQSGDTLAGIASKFNSTEEEIVKENSIADPNALFVGQLLVIPVYLVTATATRPPTSTPGPNDPTATWTPVN
jgi:LysM repeat protein